MGELTTYKNLPGLAGFCTFAEASRPGLSVHDCVARLKRYHYAFKRLHEILTARITSEPIYELKMAFSLHAHQCADHVSALRTRVGEMREPPLGLEAVPDANLEVFFDEIRSAPSTEELVAGLYEIALPNLDQALERHGRETNHLADAPSVRLIRYARMEINDIINFGKQAATSLISSAQRSAMQPWLDFLNECLTAAGDLDGSSEPIKATVKRRYSAAPLKYDATPKRDERFTDPWNQGVNAEAFLYHPDMPPKAKTLMMYFKRLREIDVPEMMSSIISETKGKPWNYYRDMSRQVWDEARHAMMGEVGFAASGIDWRIARISWNWSYRLNTECPPLARHAVLYFIEQGLMGKDGKRYEWEISQRSGDTLSVVFQDYDWADEVLHARIGRDWYVSTFNSPADALKYGDECWSQIASNWQKVVEQGLTQHENWWANLYDQACLNWGTAPDPKVRAFNETYVQSRADLKQLAGFE